MYIGLKCIVKLLYKEEMLAFISWATFYIPNARGRDFWNVEKEGRAWVRNW